MNSSPLLDTISHKSTTHTPIWLMRQAGRYLPEYRNMREKAGSFLKLCTNPELATAVTLQPLQRFSLDAAIIFSDILVIPHALGMELDFIESVGPRFATPLTSTASLDALRMDNLLPGLDYVYQAIKNVKSELNRNTPLIGFCGSPFTLACYMLEGGSSKNHLKTKDWLYNQPTNMHFLLSKLATAVSQHLIAQIDAGADIVMLFDSFGGILTEAAYQDFSFNYLQQIIQNVKAHNNKIPVILFTKGSGAWLHQLKNSGADVIGLDWMTSITAAKNTLGKNLILQGNLDPVLLAIGDKAAIKTETLRILADYKNANNGSSSGHVFNLGHGILPHTNPDNVAYLIDLVHNAE